MVRGGAECSTGSLWEDDINVSQRSGQPHGIVEPTREATEALPPECRVPKMQGGGEKGPARVIFFVDDIISVEVQ